MVFVMISVRINSDETCAACTAGVICLFVHYSPAWSAKTKATTRTISCLLWRTLSVEISFKERLTMSRSGGQRPESLSDHSPLH